MVQRASYLQKGFTIVELLVVIVVIAILAAIAIVSYNGITQQAYSAKAASTVDAYVNLIEMYQVTEGHYPATTGPVCLGTAANYPAENGFGAGECTIPASTVNDDFNNLLLQYTSQIPSADLPPVTYESLTMRGPTYVGDSEGGLILYMIKGNVTCPKGKKVEPVPGVTGCGVILGTYESDE